MRFQKTTLLLILVVSSGELLAEDTKVTRERAAAALKRSVTFFRTQVSAEGGYLWRYSADLKLREGEGKAGAKTVWVQPPGTPSVGEAYLTAYKITGDKYLLDAARETALALVRGQLESGGWDYRIEFDPKARRRYAYRVDGNKSARRNTTTFDDDTSQSALRFVMRVDQALGFKDRKIHACAEFALQSILKAQYPNGAWPQRYSAFPDPKQYPIKKASYPKTWSRTYPKKDYRGYYTFNDNSIADLIDTMFLASEIYKTDRYAKAAERAGDFIILAQMPEPQPAWAQQYDANMHPAWARKFEPPSVTGGESQGVMRTLLSLYRRTGNKKYLKPIPPALAYLKKSRLKNGRLARFYELKTNRPLYFVKDTYELTYSDANMPTHYGFKVSSKLDRIERDYKRLLATPKNKLAPRRRRVSTKLTRALQTEAAKLVASLDKRGAWVEAGRLRRAGEANRIISTSTFAKNIVTLARYVAATKKK